MLRAAYSLALALLLADFTAVAAQEGRLQQVRDEVRTTPKAGQASPHDGDEDSLFGDMFGQVFWTAIAFPFALPKLALQDDADKALEFARYPYVAAYPGYLMIDPAASPELAQTLGPDFRPKAWAVQLSLENGNDFNGMNRVGGRLLVDTDSRFGILTEWSYFRESLCLGRTDNTVIGDVNAVYRFAQNEWCQFRAGAGIRIQTDRAGTNLGVNLHYGADIFPVQPLVLSSSIDGGTLGSAGVIHLRQTIGAVFNGWELFGGYDFLRIGDVNLQGPMIGLRLWF